MIIKTKVLVTCQIGANYELSLSFRFNVAYMLHRLTAIEAQPNTAADLNDETTQSDTYGYGEISSCIACKNIITPSLNKCNEQTVGYGPP